MGTKHTAGPWNSEQPYREPGIYVAAPDTSIVARVYEQGGQGLANASLIAAAPDLLKACGPVVEWGQAHNPPDDPVVVIELTRQEFDAVLSAVFNANGDKEVCRAEVDETY